MNPLLLFSRHKKQPALIIPQPDIRMETCDNCDCTFWQINIEGNPFPLICPQCGRALN